MVATRLLDLTRLISRLGRGPMTGVDRVEFAYLEKFLDSEDRVFALVRTPVGYLLLDRIGMAALRDGRVNLTKSDFIGRLAHRGNNLRAKAEAGVRSFAVDRCIRAGLRRMVKRHFPSGGSYFSVGHANLDRRTLSQLHAAQMKIAVLVHDTIPLDFPEYTRADTVAAFKTKIAAVSQFADLVIHTTRDARAHTEAHLVKAGRVPRGVCAQLGVVLAAPQPLGFAPNDPFFVCLGTIEPRKNHALLLEVWGNLPKPRPTLCIVGGRGWSNEDVFKKLDHLSADSGILELRGLTDGEVVSLLSKAQALLFPSFAEGFGLPAVEAAALGTKVIVSNLNVFHELLEDSTVYLDPKDSYAWMETILQQCVLPKEQQSPKIPPSWVKHFNDVFSEM